MLDIIKSAFELTRKNALVLIGLLLSVFVVSMLLSFVTTALAGVPVVYFIVNIISIIFQLYLGVAIMKYILAIVDGRSAEFADIKPNFNEIIRYITAGLLVAVVFIVLFMITIGVLGMMSVVRPGVMKMFTDIAMDAKNVSLYTSNEIMYAVGVFFLMLIPALLVYLRLQFANYIVIDKPLESPINAVFMSYRMTKGYTLYLLLLILVVILLNILGLLLFIVGLVFTVPMSYLLIVILYRTLEQNYTETNSIKELEN